MSFVHASKELTSCACLEKESAPAIMAAVLSSSSLSFCPLSSSAIRARASSPTTPDAAPFMPSMLPGPGMCWARLRDAFPADNSPTVNTRIKDKKGNDKYLERVPNDLTWCWCRSWGLVNFQQQFHVLKWKHYVIRCGCFLMHRLKIITVKDFVTSFISDWEYFLFLSSQIHQHLFREQIYLQKACIKK